MNRFEKKNVWYSNDFCWFLLKFSMILADFLLPGSGSVSLNRIRLTNETDQDPQHWFWGLILSGLIFFKCILSYDVVDESGLWRLSRCWRRPCSWRGPASSSRSDTRRPLTISVIKSGTRARSLKRNFSIFKIFAFNFGSYSIMYTSDSGCHYKKETSRVLRKHIAKTRWPSKNEERPLKRDWG